MSHTTKLSSIKIQSISALRSAIEELKQKGIKCELRENQKPRAFYTDQKGMEQAEYVLYLADSRYDIGFYKAPEGHYEARTDLFAGHIGKILGGTPKDSGNKEQAQMGKLFQAYGVHATIEQARKQGKQVRRTERADGTIALEISGY